MVNARQKSDLILKFKLRAFDKYEELINSLMIIITLLINGIRRHSLQVRYCELNDGFKLAEERLLYECKEVIINL